MSLSIGKEKLSLRHECVGLSVIPLSFCPLCSDIIIPGGIALFFELSICADGSLSPSLNGGKERAVESQTKPYLSGTQCYQARRAGDSLMEWPALCGGETSAISSSRHARLTPAAVSKHTFICVLTKYITLFILGSLIVFENVCEFVWTLYCEITFMTIKQFQLLCITNVR